MQSALANWVANALSRQLKSEVKIANVNLGFLNRVIVNDLTLYEPSGKKMADIARVSASINLFSLLSGQVDIGTAQLFGVKATLYRDTPQSAPNYQFIIDAFATEKDNEPTPINLHIGSLIIRHADLAYDVKSKPTHTGTFDPNHMNWHDIGVNIVLRYLTDDSLHISLRRLQGKELHSRFAVRDTHLRLVANRQYATLSDFHLSLPHSFLTTDSICVDYGHFGKDKVFSFHGTPLNGRITPNDLNAFCAALAPYDESVTLHIQASGDEKEIRLDEGEFTIKSQNSQLQVSANITHPLDKQKRDIHLQVNTLHLNDATLHKIADTFGLVRKQPLPLDYLSYTGDINYDANSTLLSRGELTTDIGHATYEVSYDAAKKLAGIVRGDSVHIGKIQGSDTFGTTSFDLDFALNLANLQRKEGAPQPFPTGSVMATIHNIHYNNYNYKNIKIDTQASTTKVAGTASIDDDNVQANAQFDYTATPDKDIHLDLALDRFIPHNLHLTKEHEQENLTFKASADLHGSDFQHLYGTAALKDFLLHTSSDQYSMRNLEMVATKLENGESTYSISSDIVSGRIQGETTLPEIAQCFVNQVAHHLPIVLTPHESCVPQSHFSYDFTFTDAPILHHLTDMDFTLDKPVRIYGQLGSADHSMSTRLVAPHITYNGKSYTDIAANCEATPENMNLHAMARTTQASENADTPPTDTNFDLVADIHDNRIACDLYLKTTGRNNIILQLLPVIQFRDSLGTTKTDITLRQSHATINDTTWTVSPALISLYGKDIECRGVKFANMGTNSSLTIDGKASPLPSDSLVTTLNNIQIEYILSMVNFDAVRFAGKVSGRVTMGNVLGESIPNIKTNLHIENFSLQEGPLGDADITARWDKKVEGITMEGRIIDLYKVQDALSGHEKNTTGITTLKGWVSPSRNDMAIHVDTHHTNAAFLHGFLKGVFKEINGHVTGAIDVIGPLNNVNIVGDAVPDINLRLRATNVPYHIEGDTLHFRPYLFDFNNISIYDRFGHRSRLDGQVTHRNMKNFTYKFEVDMYELLAYDETEFNSDKFLATVMADGHLSIDGADGHPLYVQASVTPTRGSVFAYDAATPDAITASSFIEFRNRDSLDITYKDLLAQHQNKTTEQDSLAIVNEAKKNYNSDIFIDFDINLTPDCEVKLRMDNIDDGYMTTYGNAKLSAKWYNKGAFQLFGNYEIATGSYRLHLQDPIYRDLQLQPTSRVMFNGNPFNADIHLLCHHTIASVPLSDLTATNAYTPTGKTRVVCVLDITGKLGRMDFKFNLDLPQANEETRQLVRAMINSQEETNTQALYLLGLGRFYPTAISTNTDASSTGAATTLLSSTLNGQINQALSRLTDTGGHWNFGSTLATGQRGWEDLDVEGLLTGHLLDNRLTINGAIGYRDNATTNRSHFVGDFEAQWRMAPKSNLYLKAYNRGNDRYFTPTTLQTQGLGLSWRNDFGLTKPLRKKSSKRGKSAQTRK